MHTENAREERAQFDPAQTRTKPQARPMPIDGVPTEDVESYNPTGDHLVAADREMSEANSHLAAARKLVSFEDRACAGLGEAERQSCPLLASAVSRVQSTAKGFTLILKPSADVTLTNQRLSCHLAYAVSTGFDRPSCPLFVKGTTLKRVGADGIDFIGDSPAATAELKAQARRVFRGAEQSAFR